MNPLPVFDWTVAQFPQSPGVQAGNSATLFGVFIIYVRIVAAYTVLCERYLELHLSEASHRTASRGTMLYDGIL